MLGVVRFRVIITPHDAGTRALVPKLAAGHRASLGRLECSFLSHLRQQRLQLISQPNNVLRVLSLPPRARRIQAKYGGGCPVESLSDIAAKYEFGGAHRGVNRVNRSA